MLGTLRLYERVAVAEYWVVDPASKSIQRYCLSGSKYDEGLILVGTGLVASKVLEGFSITLEELFSD